jgi:hypothetical protein
MSAMETDPALNWSMDGDARLDPSGPVSMRESGLFAIPPVVAGT